MLMDWMRKIHTLEYGHRFESIKWSRLNLWLGLPALIFSILIGVTATGKPDSPYCVIKFIAENKELIVFLGGLTIAILTGLQTFLKPLELAEKHRSKSIAHEKLRHKIEYILQFYSTIPKPEDQIENIRKEWADIDALNVSKNNFTNAKKKIKSFNKYFEELGFLDTIPAKN
jgi:hypothetical protein